MTDVTPMSATCTQVTLSSAKSALPAFPPVGPFRSRAVDGNRTRVASLEACFAALRANLNGVRAGTGPERDITSTSAFNPLRVIRVRVRQRLS